MTAHLTVESHDGIPCAALGSDRVERTCLMILDEKQEV